MPFNFSSPEYLSHHRTRKNRVSPVSRASPAHMNSPLICNSKHYYAMFKITKCENCVVCLQFALIATSRLKPGKVLKVIYICLDKGRIPVLHFLY